MKALGGIAPFGYRWENGTLVVDQDEAPIRRLIYDLFLKHRRKKTVAKLLNDLGYRTRSASLFSDTTIDRLLRDTTAKGTREVAGRTVEVEPIVTTEIWERVNRILGGDNPGKHLSHLFSGRAYCGCGGKMIVHHGSQKYVCIDCRHKILIDDLEAIFHSQLKGPAEVADQMLYENWQFLTSKEKAAVTEQVCDRVIIDRDTIHVELTFPLPSDKTAIVAPQNEIGNETHVDKPTDSVTEPLLSEAEAAGFLGISKMTLLRKRNAREIAFFKVGHRILYSKEKHLIPFLRQCENVHRQARPGQA